MIGDLLYQFGRALGGLSAHATDPEDDDFEGVDAGTDPEITAAPDPSQNGADHGQTALVGTALALFLARAFRPRPVSWPRVILSGVAATALADFIGRRFERSTVPGRLPYAEDAGELVARLMAGVAIAAGYASLIYPRLPGSPLVRGLAFGALEIVAAPRGGVLRMATQSPGVRFPLQALASPVDEDAGPLAHMAFGLGLGLFYRYGRAKAEEWGHAEDFDYEEYELVEDDD